MTWPIRKTLWRDRNERLDPETDFTEIYRNVAVHDFPWDFNQSLSFALFRTYAVPSIGRLLDETRQFADQTQKRYDDTVLLLEAPLVSGLGSPDGRAAIRRINQMHAMYDISNDDLRYVLATFVVVPKRWIDDHCWRRLSAREVRASVNYYRALGRRMAIADIPDTFDEFARLMDDYEREHFRYDAGSRRVADATMELMASFYPAPARRAVLLFSRALMDEPLLSAFHYDAPSLLVRRLSMRALRARARVLAVVPSRRRPRLAADSNRIKSYPDGGDLTSMGTFAPGCPIPRPVARPTPQVVPED